jgi:hypothetical protein
VARLTAMPAAGELRRKTIRERPGQCRIMWGMFRPAVLIAPAAAGVVTATSAQVLATVFGGERR